MAQPDVGPARAVGDVFGTHVEELPLHGTVDLQVLVEGDGYHANTRSASHSHRAPA